MASQTRTKRERVIEAVRRGLDGDDAVDFIHQCGFAMTQAGVARHLRAMGGRGPIQELIDAGHTNTEVLDIRMPDQAGEPVPSQPELFAAETFEAAVAPKEPRPEFETTKITVKLPTDLYEAVKLAARAEGRNRNDIIVDILTSALAQMPPPRALDQGTA